MTLEPRRPSSSASTNQGGKKKRRHSHGRRRLDLANLPVERLVIDPPEVAAAGGKGFLRIGEEVSDRLAFRPASYFRLRLVRGKWVTAPEPDAVGSSPVVEDGSLSDNSGPDEETTRVETDAPKPVLVAPLPDGVWPNVMADPSAVAQVILSKYDDVTPLHRQERISVRQGFALPRSTQCGWLVIAYALVRRVVDAMLAEACRMARLIATDATGAPVRKVGGSAHWHVFVFIADRDHVVFRYAAEHSGPTVRAFLKGFHGTLLADAAPIYDVLYREEDMTELLGCWFHARRYFWKALETDRDRAMEALSIIAKLFVIDAECREIEMPVRTVVRAQRAGPILALFDAWIDTQRDRVDPRGPLDKAIGYYDNQRTALHRFLDDGRWPLDNGVSERELRNLALGRHTFGPFANETGVQWYTTFRSLLASCALHGLNGQLYLRAAPAPRAALARHPDARALPPSTGLRPSLASTPGTAPSSRAPWETADAVTEAAAESDRAA